MRNQNKYIFLLNEIRGKRGDFPMLNFRLMYVSGVEMDENVFIDLEINSKKIA